MISRTMLLATLLVSCAPAGDEITGKWIAIYSAEGEANEFFEDQTCLLDSKGARIPCSWVLLSDGRVKMEVERLGTKVMLLGTRDGDILTVDLPKGETSRLVRAGSGSENEERTAGLHGRGLMFYTEKRYPDALKHFSAAAELGSHDSMKWAAEVYTYCENKRYRDADLGLKYALKSVEHVAQAEEERRKKDPNSLREDWRRHRTLADAYGRKGKFAEAAQAMERALSFLDKERNMEADRLQEARERYQGRLQLYREGKTAEF